MPKLNIDTKNIDISGVIERWNYVLATMIMGDPFVHEFLMMMKKVSNPLVGTMGVHCEGTEIILAYNPYFVQLLSDDQLRWVLNHEVLHVALHHCTLRQPEDKKQSTLWNYAADLAINQLIKENSMTTKPDEKVIKPLFPDAFGFPEKLSMEQYLQLLWKWDEENKQNQQGDGEGDENSDGSNNGDSDDNNSDDKKGGLSGKDDNEPQAPKGGQVVDDHSGFEESDVLDQVIKNKINEMLNQDKYWGHMSGDAKQAIEAAQKARVNWRKILRHQLGRFATEEKEPTIMRPNRRFGYPYTGKTNVHVDRILVAMDTSGSVSDKALSQFIAECNKAKDYNPIDIVQFDHTIQVGPVPFDRKMKRYEAQGRGGTAFTPVFELAEKKRYKCLVVLTDGEAEAPPYPKFCRDVIWCLLQGKNAPVPWGRKIHIKDNALW